MRRRICGVVVWLRKSGSIPRRNLQVTTRITAPTLAKRPMIGLPCSASCQPSWVRTHCPARFTMSDDGNTCQQISVAIPDRCKVEGCVGRRSAVAKTWTRAASLNFRFGVAEPPDRLRRLSPFSAILAEAYRHARVDENARDRWAQRLRRESSHHLPVLPVRPSRAIPP